MCGPPPEPDEYFGSNGCIKGFVPSKTKTMIFELQSRKTGKSITVKGESFQLFPKSKELIIYHNFPHNDRFKLSDYDYICMYEEKSEKKF